MSICYSRFVRCCALVAGTILIPLSSLRAEAPLNFVKAGLKAWATCQMSGTDCTVELPDGGIKVRRIAMGLVKPTFVTATPSDPQHIYALEHWSGKVWKLDRDTGAATLFMTVPNMTIGYSLGLMGLAFHLDYAANRKLYVSYTRGGNPIFSVIREYTVNASGVPGSPRDVLVYQKPTPQHNNGWIGFGADGMLYITTGDGGPQLGGIAGNGNPSQRLDQIFGKLLRIDVNGTDAGLAYRIPDGTLGETPNPFIGTAEQPYVDSFGNPARREIWAFGLRNPWRSGFDRETGDCFVGDVGQEVSEYIHFIDHDTTGGENFGWCVMEGTHPTSGIEGMENCATETSAGPLIAPIHEYTHVDGRNCIIGGYVYRGTAIPELNGTYFFADNGSDEIFSFHFNTLVRSVEQFLNRTNELLPDPADVPPASGIDAISSFGEDAFGEIYIVSYAAGTIYRIVPRTQLVHCAKADLNCDGQRNGRDIVPFVEALIEGNDVCQADVTEEGLVTVDDIPPFAELLVGE